MSVLDGCLVVCGFCGHAGCVRSDDWPDSCPVMQPLDPDQSTFQTLLTRLPGRTNQTEGA